jgi:hypothetical protein
MQHNHIAGAKVTRINNDIPHKRDGTPAAPAYVAAGQLPAVAGTNLYRSRIGATVRGRLRLDVVEPVEAAASVAMAPQCATVHGRYHLWPGSGSRGQEGASVHPRLVAIAVALAQRLPDVQLLRAHLQPVVQVAHAPRSWPSRRKPRGASP